MSSIYCFIGPQGIVLVLVVVPVILIVLLFIVLIKYLRRKSRPQRVVKELQKEFNKYEDSLFSEKDIKDYYPVKEGNKITLIRFDEIVDFSASNNYVFVTDANGKDYLVDSNLVMKCEKPRIVSCSKNYNEKIKSIIDF